MVGVEPSDEGYIARSCNLSRLSDLLDFPDCESEPHRKLLLQHGHGIGFSG